MRNRSIRSLLISALCLLKFVSTSGLSVAAAAARPTEVRDSTNRVSYLGRILEREANGKNLKDSFPSFNLLKIFCHVTIIDSSGVVSDISTFRADTLVAKCKYKELMLQMTLRLDTSLVPVLAAINYDLKGSARIRLNGHVIFQNGSFADSRLPQSSKTKLKDFVTVSLEDTLQELEVLYRPERETYWFALALGQQEWAEKKIVAKSREVDSSLAVGFFYLAFGILFFSLFLFHRAANENFYFALFCITGAAALLFQNADNSHLVGFSLGCLMISMETLAIFLSKVIKNKLRSHIPLFISFVFALALSAITLRLFETREGTFDEPLGLTGLLCLMASGFFSGFSIVYYLIQGFWQKSWEARTIVYFNSIAILLIFIVPVGAGLFDAATGDELLIQTDTLSDIGLCLIPFSMAVVLGKRNRMNEAQLIRQIQSIQQLSDENLSREREKQEYLELQKSELERLVNERTGEVVLQKEVIEAKNRAITDNLNYAQRIQSAMLPDVALISQHFPRIAVVYYPKDIVSGDFYFFSHANGRTVIAAGDCTGHGVSGAFMSMIGTSLLNQIVNERGISDPAMILEALNIAIIDTFHQQQNATNDGMDIALCVRDDATNELNFAGANRPLWLIREGELNVFDPDKSPIGGLQMARDRSFHRKSMTLLPGDTVYIFTDGYADQFGGPHGKKMMTAKFKELLISIQQESMESQQVLLQKHFNDWKGGREQVDDVLVIGIRA